MCYSVLKIETKSVRKRLLTNVDCRTVGNKVWKYSSVLKVKILEHKVPSSTPVFKSCETKTAVCI